MISVQYIQKALYLSYYKHICLANAHLFRNTTIHSGPESDFAFITKAGYGYEVEIKKTYKDFRRDFKNKAYKHELIAKEKGLQNYFSFCFDGKELMEKCLPEIPTKYGVCYAYEYVNQKNYKHEKERDVVILIAWNRKPQILHKNKMDWQYIAMRVAVSYKTKVFEKLKWEKRMVVGMGRT